MTAEHPVSAQTTANTDTARIAEQIGAADPTDTPATRIPLLRWTFGLVNRIVMAGDIGVILLSSLVTIASPTGLSNTPMQNLLLAVLEASVFVRTLRMLGSYRVENYEKPIAALIDLIPGLLCAWAVSAIYYGFFAGQNWNLALLSFWHGPQLLGLILARQAARLLARHVASRALVRRNVVVIGANPTGASMLENLLSPAEKRHYNVVGVFADASDENQSTTLLGMPILGDISMLAAYANRNVVDIVIVALPLARAMERVQMIEDLQWMATDVVIPMNEIRVAPVSARLAKIVGHTTLQIFHRPLRGSEAVLKIVEDYVIASIVLLIVSPIMLAVAIAIRLDSKGPVFFMQERIGFNNNPFRIYKFRTMTTDPEDDGSIGTQHRDDPRITRVGRVLRRLSIDELPQVLNVLRGDMSIVGPRPYVKNMLVGTETFRTAVNNYAFRYRLKPGITGLAQASGMRSNALRSMVNARKSIELDLEYISKWSIWLDIKIMVRTVLVAMTGPDVF